MKKCTLFVIFYGLMLVMISCVPRHYLGLHRPSVKRYPEVHEGVADDEECLKCHHPDREPVGLPTTHPNFTGCLKCHNDDIEG